MHIKKRFLSIVAGLILISSPASVSPNIDRHLQVLGSLSPLMMLAYNQSTLKDHRYGKYLPAVAAAGLALLGAKAYWSASYKELVWDTNLKIPEETKGQIRSQLGSYRLKESTQNKLDYFKWIEKFPFGVSVQPLSVDLDAARRQMDSTHFGLSVVKESIVDYLAGLWASNGKSPKVICFDGVPGTGKTTLAQSIAKALGKEFFAINLADTEATYLYCDGHGEYDAKGPGKLARALIDTKSLNPVVLLDELEKVKDYNVLSAFLPILDPAQNSKIRDKYLGFDMDLSNVTFIVTVNDLGKLPDALKNRMQIIHLHPYSMAERAFIALNMLIPQIGKKMNLSEDIKGRLEKIVDPLAVKVMRMDGGMRAFRRCLEVAAEKYARQLIENKDKRENEWDLQNVSCEQVIATINPELLSAAANDRAGVQASAGVINSLQVRGVDGSGGLLVVESLVIPHGSGKLMKNLQADVSCKQIQLRVFSYVKTITQQYGINDSVFKTSNFIFGDQASKNVDGASLGLAYAVSLISALTKRPVKPGFAVTGAIDMHGNVLPVENYRDKILGSESRDVANIVVPASARATLESIKESFPHLNVFYVSTVLEALELLLET